jgi:hypothetical protein
MPVKASPKALAVFFFSFFFFLLLVLLISLILLRTPGAILSVHEGKGFHMADLPRQLTDKDPTTILSQVRSTTACGCGGVTASAADYAGAI